MYEPIFIQDGDTAFGIEDTFQIHDTLFVLSDEALYLLETVLGAHEYILEAPKHTTSGRDYFTARKRHKQTHDEGLNDVLERQGRATKNPLSFIVSLRYLNKEKHSLAEEDIHGIIVSAAGQRRDIGYYNRPTDHFNNVALSRMTGFVKNVVAVPMNKWQAFLDEHGRDHAQDFIRGMAWWAGMNSDMKPRSVRIYAHENETVDPSKPFIRKYPKDRGLFYIR